jgi:hypothetical protein
LVLSVLIPGIPKYTEVGHDHFTIIWNSAYFISRPIRYSVISTMIRRHRITL